MTLPKIEERTLYAPLISYLKGLGFDEECFGYYEINELVEERPLIISYNKNVITRIKHLVV